MSEWNTLAIKNISKRITSGGTPSTKCPEYYGGNIPWLNTKEVNFRPIASTETYISEQGLDNSSAKWIDANSIVVAMYGATAGKSAITKIPLTTNQACCNITVDANKADYRFIYYSLLDSYDQLENMATGAAQQNLNAGMISNFEILLPDLSEQKAIASVLSSLDDKIDLLHRQNLTLEALAETFFRQWFVEEVQEDWEKGKVEDLFLLQRGFDLPAQSRTDGPYPIFAASGYSGGHTEYKVKGPCVTTGRSGLLGKVFFVLEDLWPLNTSLYVKEFKRGGPLFSYFFLKTLDLSSFNAGSAVPTLNRNHVHEEKALIPPPELVARFEKIAFPLYQKIRQNELQVSDLETLRDTLLPKLMSGEVRVAV